MTNSTNKVVIVKGENEENAIDFIFRNLRVKEKLNEQNVSTILIKPNLLAASQKTAKRCSWTNPELIKLLSRRLSAMGFEVSIGEGTASKYITANAFKYSGIASLQNEGIEIVNFNTSRLKEVKVEGNLKRILIPEEVLDTDFLISLPIMKTHLLTLVTLSLKNMMGAIGEREANRMHYVGLHESIATLTTVIKPNLSIIDAKYGMEGTGPLRGKEVKLDTLIGSYDPVSVDAIGARLRGFDPYSIVHIKLAEEKGVGNINPDDTIGEMKIRPFLKPGEDGLYDFWGDKFQSSRSFNFLMCNRVLHSLVYDYSFYILKDIRNRFFIGRKEKGDMD